MVADVESGGVVGVDSHVFGFGYIYSQTNIERLGSNLLCMS